MRVLSVDDRTENQYLLSALFRGADHEVVSAANGVEGLKILEKQTFDLIVSDVLMPQMDGYQFCREVKRKEAYRKIPFVFYSATYVDKKDEEFGLSLGAACFLVKPMEPDHFLARIDEVLKQAAKNPPVPAQELPDDSVFLNVYNERLVRKLDKKIQELEASSKSLRQALAEKEREVTERKQAQAAKDALQDQLRQSQKMEAIGRLASGVAHDFNNILTGILGYCDLALMEIDNPQARTRIEEVIKAANRAGTMTKQLLSLSRKQFLQIQVLNANSVILDLHPLLDRLIGSQVKLKLDLSSNALLIKFDAGQLEQIVLNLVLNARDAMPSGGEVVISTANVERRDVAAQWGTVKESTGILMLSVKDCGTGMSPETFSHLFEPYFTTKAKDRGTGLGLSTVYGIANQTGCAIGVDSELGVGTTFKIFFPASKETAIYKSPLKALSESRRGSETILVAEDSTEIAEFLEIMLKGLGYSVLIAHSSEDAVKMLQQHPGNIHLLLTDVIMPGKNGRQLAEEAIKLRPRIKLLFTSGFAADDLTQQTVERLAGQFLEKPFTSDTLSKRIRQLLEG